MLASPRILLLSVAVLLIAFNLGFQAAPVSHSLDFSAPAIGEDGKGTLVAFSLHAFAGGKGRLLVNVKEAAFKPDVEHALRQSAAAAESYLGVQLNHYDLLLEVQDSSNIREVSGESAGALFSAAVVALMSNHKLRSDTIVSASLDAEGKMGPVGGIEEKILAASQQGKRVFLVSADQEIKYSQLGDQIAIKRAKTLSEALPYLLS